MIQVARAPGDKAKLKNWAEQRGSGDATKHTRRLLLWLKKEKASQKNPQFWGSPKVGATEDTHMFQLR